MTVQTDPQKASFQLSMLIYDTRYRSITIQVVALVGFLIAIGWLVSNTASNLGSLGKEPGFGFLWEPAGYDINQRLLDYNSQSPHIRAAFIGVLNTLVIAVMGCITATVLGVLIGVLRLSNNWVVSRLMAVYVETFRNVPVLLWIALAMAILIESLPAPRAFRGENPEATLSVFGSVAVTNRGIYLPEPRFSDGFGDYPVFSSADDSSCADYYGGTYSLQDLSAGPLAPDLENSEAMKTAADAYNSCGTFQISLDLMVILILLMITVYISRRIKKWADEIQENTGDRPTIWHVRLGVVLVPMAILLWYLDVYLSYPELKGFNFKGGLHLRNSLIALWLALSLYTAAFIAEIVRAGILAISEGQTEAASALGLRSKRTMSLVILPQALRVIIPPLISNYLNLTKNSSLAIVVGYMDVTGTLMGITLNQTGRELETILLGMVVYLTISLSISLVMNWYNESVKLKER